MRFITAPCPTLAVADALLGLHPPRPPREQTKDYPPWRRRIEVWYDGDNRKVRAFVHEGFEANKTFLRRYDAKQEYVVRDDEFAECRRAYLSESCRGRGAAGARRCWGAACADTCTCAHGHGGRA